MAGNGPGSTLLATPMPTSNFNAMFPTSEATYHAEGDFDHCLTIVSQYYDAPVRRPFKFYNLCTKDENFMTLVAQKLG